MWHLVLRSVIIARPGTMGIRNSPFQMDDPMPRCCEKKHCVAWLKMWHVVTSAPNLISFSCEFGHGTYVNIPNLLRWQRFSFGKFSKTYPDKTPQTRFYSLGFSLRNICFSLGQSFGADIIFMRANRVDSGSKAMWHHHRRGWGRHLTWKRFVGGLKLAEILLILFLWNLKGISFPHV